MEVAILTAQPYSKCAPKRLRAVADALQRLDKEDIKGDIVECGVWRGGIVILARLLSPHRTVWLYDTFNGMMNRSKFDTKPGGFVMREGKAAVPVNEVLANLTATNTKQDEFLHIVVGRVEDTLLVDDNLPSKIALLHLDTDWYHSTKIELEKLWPRLRPRGILIVDDYGHWQGARKAVDEYFSPLQRNIIHIDKTAIMMVKC